MPSWAPFLAVTALLTLLLLILARLSEATIEEYAPPADGTNDESTPNGADEEPTPDGSEDESTPNSREGSALPTGEESITDTETDSWPKTETTDTTFQKEGPAFQKERSTFQPEERTSPKQETEGQNGVFEPPADRQPEREQREDIVLTARMLMANVVVTQAIVIAILVLSAWYFDIPAAAFGITGDAFSTGLPAVAVGVVFGTVLWMGNELSTSVADAVGASYNERVRELLAPDSPAGWVGLFGLVLPTIAVAEELLFRAALIGVPNAGYGLNLWLLAVVSSLAFAFGHGAQGRVGVIVTGALGFVLAAGYIVTGSLLMVIVAHYVINALEFFIHELLGVDDITLTRPQSNP